MMNTLFRTLCLTMIYAVSSGAVFSASEFSFDDSGKPKILILGGENFLKGKVSSGFTLSHTNGKETTKTDLSKVVTSGNKIKVSHPDGKPNFIFQIDTHPNHIAIHLLDAEGLGTGRGYNLSLELNSKDIAAYTLNDLMTANSGNRRKKKLELNWPYLWGRTRPNGTHGSVVLYSNTLDDKARDAVLAEIWSIQGTAGHMVRPAGQATWTEADVLAWVEKWVAKFSSIAKVSVAAESNEELYKMTDAYVFPSGANRVYMFSNVWRAKNQGFVSVNPKIFPKGKEDMLAYQKYLESKGVHLQLKSLSPQIGEQDKQYISPTFVDKRIMNWATGQLVEAIDPSATTIRFRLKKETIETTKDGVMRLGNELILAKEIKRTAENIWILEGCKRGYGGSTAKSHKAGAEMAACILRNGSFNFKDDFGLSNSIAEEICGEYGDFLNEVNVGHLHFDGTGRMGQIPWYVRDFTDYVYSRVDQPVTGSKVGGSIWANFERMFSAAKAIEGATGYRDIRIGPRLHQKGRKHTEFSVSKLDMHFDVMDGIRLGSRRPSLLGGQSGARLSLEVLNNWGLTDYAVQLFKYWVELAPVFDTADADYVASFLSKERGHHFEGEDVLVLSKNGSGKYIFTPHRVMGQTSGEDAPFKIDQEWGAVPRFQQITSGTKLELLNPYETQEPQVVINVKEGSKPLKNPVIKINGSGELKVTGEVQAYEYLKFARGGAKVYDKNWNFLRSLPVKASSLSVSKGKNTVTVAAGGGSGSADFRVQFITLGPVYLLKSNEHLK